MSDRQALLAELRLTENEVSRRVAAARALSYFEDDETRATLLAAACNPAEDPDVAFEAGRAFARILFKAGQVYEAPLVEFTGPGGDGFDLGVAQLQRDD